MVRTKADGAMRVAAGGKAPKKNASRPASTFSPSANDKGGHLPGNRACPRETPTWQKKITFFYDKNATGEKSTEDSDEGNSSNSKDNPKAEKNEAVTDESSAQVDDGVNTEMEEGNASALGSSKVDESESMETDD